MLEEEDERTDFLKACLLKLGLETAEGSTTVPSLSRLHLSSCVPTGVDDLLQNLAKLIVKTDGADLIEGENDCFQFEDDVLSSQLASTSLHNPENSQPSNKSRTVGEGFLDYNRITKIIVSHKASLPSPRETPYFNHQAFYANLRAYSSNMQNEKSLFGQHLLYGEVVTSTSTLLEK